MAFDAELAADEIRNQWRHPADIFSILLLLGGDVVARALAQSTGRFIGLPLFSFGWVAYAVNALVSVVGENQLLPPPDFNCIVINGTSGYVRANKNWVIGRLVRDLEFWMPQGVMTRVEGNLERKWVQMKEKARRDNLPAPTRPSRAGLCIPIFRPDLGQAFGETADTRLLVECLTVAMLQLALAAIPCGLYGDWSILMITAVGIALSCSTGSLPQWRRERWAGRRLTANADNSYILTAGNGSQYALVVLGCEGFPNLEDLASGPVNATASASRVTRFLVAGLAILWTLLLITAAGLEQNTWFLLAIGGIGILFNAYVAGKPEDPGRNGLPLSLETVICETGVMSALFELAKLHPRIALSMLATFFPGELRSSEQTRWNKLKDEIKADQ